MRVDPNAREPQPDFHRLYAAYQDAWRGFCAEVRVWQSLLADGADGTAVEQAITRVGRAEAYYREHRNKLADCMIARTRSGRAFTDHDTRESTPVIICA
jgi:hypothetical protein